MTTAASKFDTKSQRIWEDCCLKEEKLKLKWFLNNKSQIEKSAQPKEKNQETQRLFKETEENVVKSYRNEKRAIRCPIPEPELKVEYSVILAPMREVDESLKKLFYEPNTQHRKLYLKERYKILPEDRYYLPETASFEYGWKMFHESKKRIGEIRFAKQHIIRDSFYRPSGVYRDPDNYREPTKLSPTVCNMN